MSPHTHASPTSPYPSQYVGVRAPGAEAFCQLPAAVRPALPGDALSPQRAAALPTELVRQQQLRHLLQRHQQQHGTSPLQV